MDYPKTRMDNFYAKAAGSDMADMSMKPITDREYWINELAARLAEGGLVPPIEEGDDGKVLTASDGEAVWASGGGGGGGDAVHINYDAETLKIDKSYNDLLEYSNSGKMVFFISAEEDDGNLSIDWFPLIKLTRTPNDQTVTYSAIFGSSDFNFTFLSNDPDEPMLNDY